MRFWFPAMIKYSLSIYFWNFLHTVALVSIHLSVKIVPWSTKDLPWSTKELNPFSPLENEQTMWWPYDELHGFRFFSGLFRIQSISLKLRIQTYKQPFLIREWNVKIITRTTYSSVIKRSNVPLAESNFEYW